jgi:AraC-like DNA-binding protein
LHLCVLTLYNKKNEVIVIDTQFISRHLGNLSIFVTGREECKPGHHFSAAFPDRFLIHYIVSGKGLFRTGGKEYQLGAGNAFLIGNQYGYYEADSKDPWTYIWIQFSGEIAVHFLKEVGLSPNAPIYATTNKKEMEACFERILDITDWNNDFLVYSRFFYLLGKMLETNKKGYTAKKSTKNKYVQQCCDFIHANYYQNITIKQVCHFVGLEYSYLFRLFKAECNMSPKQYLIDYRLSKAASLLKETTMNVNNIAEAVGYEDRAAFSKAFSKRYGQPPRAYRSR